MMALRSAVHLVLASRKVPKPKGAAPHGIIVEAPGRMLFISLQLPVQPPAGAVFTGEVRRQAELVLHNLRNLVVDAAFGINEVVRVCFYLTDLKNQARVDEVYLKVFGTHTPARTLLQVAALPDGAHVAADAIAVKRAEPQPVAPGAAADNPDSGDYADEPYY